MGAWTDLYRKGQTGTAGTPLAYAITAIKRELDYNGYGEDLTLSGLTFGVSMNQAVQRFQADHGLTPDGVVGPTTSRALFDKRFAALATRYGVPDSLVCKGTKLESALDPGAVGVADIADHGIVQINAAAHPEITIAEAFDPAFALDYYARVLGTGFAKYHDWDCAIAAWNVGGGGASDWCAMHKPATGGPFWFPDLFARATRYVQLVRAQTC
jgi:hypothetical protein